MRFKENHHKWHVCLDFDGCTDTVAARQYLIGHLTAVLKNHPQITELEVSIGSTRSYAFTNDFHAAYVHHTQAKKCDYHMPYDSCVILQTEFLPQLQQCLQQAGLSHVAVTFDTLTIADVFNEQATGFNFNLMHAYHSQYEAWGKGQETVNIVDPDTGASVFDLKSTLSFNCWDSPTIEYTSGNMRQCQDEYKWLLLLLHMHDKAGKLLHTDTSAAFTLQFFDDRHDILKNAWHLFNENKDLIPYNCTLSIDPLNLEANALPFDDITAQFWAIEGTGPINRRFAQNIRAITDTLCNPHQFTSIEQAERAHAAFEKLYYYVHPQARVIPSYPEEASTFIRHYISDQTARQAVEEALGTIFGGIFGGIIKGKEISASEQDTESALRIVRQKIADETQKRVGSEYLHQLKCSIQGVFRQQDPSKIPPTAAINSPLTILNSLAAVNQSKHESSRHSLDSLATTIIPFSR